MNRRLLSLARGPRFSLVLTILSGLFAGWLTIGQARGLSIVVDGVFLGGKSWLETREVMLLLVVVIGLRALLGWVTEECASAVAVSVKADLRARLFAKLHSLGPAFTQGERTGELTTAALEGVEALDAYFSQYLPQLVLTALVPLSILVFVFPLDPLSGVVLLVTAPLIPLFMVLIGKGAEAVTRRQYETLGRLSAHFLDSLQGLVTLKQFGRSRAHARSIAETSNKYRDVTLGVLRITFLSALALELISTMSTAVVAVEVGLRLLHGLLPFDKALFLLILAPEFYIPLRMLGLRFHAGMAGTTAATRIYSILDQKEQGEQDYQGNTGKRDSELHPAITRFESLKIANLSYSYLGESQQVLKNIDLQINAGQQVALVGPSGGGKSTLAAILLRFLAPVSGQITFNKLSMKEIPVNAWRELVAWVPQAPHLFHDTIAANLRIAKKDATEAEMTLAVRAACLEEFIDSLPGKMNTIVGEEGARLSGGQAQRLALARAFLKDAPILILDEPTSSLDPQTESLLEVSTRRLMQGRTVITIAHRLNTITAADCIVYLRAGSIEESGTHNELIARRSAYYDMVGAMKVMDSDFPKTTESANPALREIPVVDRGQVSSLQTQIQKSELSTLARLLSFLNGSWSWVGISVLLGALTIAASVGLMGSASWLIATAALQPSIAELNIAIVGVRFFGILRGISRYAERLTSHNVTFRLLARLRLWFYEKLEPLAPSHLAMYRTGDLLNRILTDVDVLENFYVRVLAPVLVALIVSIGTSVFLGAYDPLVGWVYFSFSLLLGLVIPALTSFLGRIPGGDLVRLRSALRVRAVDAIQGLADLLAFGRGEDFLADLKQEGEAYGRAQKRMSRVTGFSSAAGIFLSNLGMWTVLALSIPMVSGGRLDGVMLPVLALMAQAGFEAVLPLPLAFQLLSSNMTAAKRLFEVVAGKEAQAIPVGPSLKPPSSLPSSSIHFTGLTFTYPGSISPALQDITFDLLEGKKIAIVGPSGAGKSTLVNLLMRFWQVPPGTIRLGGQELLEIPEETTRAYFSVISQTTHLFNISIRENLLLANPAAEQVELEQAAQRAGIQDFILSLSKGYETMVGERGLRLSGGERQRLAIARALLKNAPIFLLDEPTANLDPLTGKAILENIIRQASNRSLLLITHRIIGLEGMDEILVLDKGHIS